MSKIVKDTVILLIITLVSGLGLGFVYNVTKEPRAKQAEKTRMEAYENVFETAASFGKSMEIDKDEISKYILESDNKTKQSDTNNSNSQINATVDEIVEAYDESGNVLGYVITVTDNEAYDGAVTLSVGITIDGTVNGISYLAISETPGLGMKATDESFINQFKNKNVDYFKYTKAGASSDEEIDALSGATITTNAVANGATAAIYCFDYITGGGQNE